MAFNQLLWSLQSKVINKLLQDNPHLGTRSIAPHHFLPITTKIYVDKFEKIINEYKSLQEFIDLSTGQCNPSVLSGNPKGLYLEVFCNGLSTIMQNMNHKLLDIEESFLSESGISMLEVLDRLEYIVNVLPSLNFALSQVKEGKFRGCTMLNLCDNLINSGNESVENEFRRIQQHCLRQFYKQTKLWVMQAVLDDPYDEFFISSEELNTSLNSTSLTSMSEFGTNLSSISRSIGLPKVNVNPQNLPNMIPLSVALKMVFIGEALTICQHNDIESKSNDKILSNCGISEQDIVAQFTAIEKKDNFCITDFTSLIDDLYIGVNQYICQISEKVGHITYQLILMREIYLLGRGELFQEFLLKGSSILNSDVTVGDSRNLNKVFKDAIYNVYLTESSDLTDQFFFVLPDKKALRQGSPVWSNMTLKYKCKWPLHYLFTREVITTYNKLFCFLLKLKKAQIDTTAWKNINSVRNHSLRMELIEVRMHLMSVVGNLQNYCFTNVISDEVTVLFDSVKSTTLFTDLKRALSLFLTNIGNRLFLPDIGLISSTDSEKTLDVSALNTVNKCFKTIFFLCGLFSKLNGRDDAYVSKKLSAIKSELQSVLKTMFSLLQKIDYYESSSSSSHLSNLMMCLDYNGFFRNKFHLELLD